MKKQTDQAMPATNYPNVQARAEELARRGRLIGPEELAEAINVKRSWVYARTRQTDCGGLPVVWVGRYPRFDLGEVMAWLRTQPHPKAAA